MHFYRVNNHEEFKRHLSEMQRDFVRREKLEKNLLGIANENGGRLPGLSYTAGKDVDFLVNTDGRQQEINWRETVICPVTRLNNRTRLAYHYLDEMIGIGADDYIYITEQATSFYRYLSNQHSSVTGSEFFANKIMAKVASFFGIKNEDLTSLSYPDDSFDKIISFDCFEHIPHYCSALRECWRVLKSGGFLVFTVPFAANSADNIVRARMSEIGEIEYLLQPEYHGNPVGISRKCLCYYHFGWELLDNLKDAGFSEAYAVFAWSQYYGYLGGEQILFVAKKS